MKSITRVTNGNYQYEVFADGTKVRTFAEPPKPVFPETLDVKITDSCNLGCPYCHESSTPAGLHGDLTVLAQVLSELPAGVELAIGGGNPLAHPDLIPFLTAMRERGFICNITVNQRHLPSPLLNQLVKQNLVYGVGISISKRDTYGAVLDLCELTPNVVFHVIAGVTDFNLARRHLFTFPQPKLLVLGYKQFGFGKQYFSDQVAHQLKYWRDNIHYLFGRGTLSFDNLAIEQLEVQRLFTIEGWKQFYMGDDFVFSMYVDAVRQEYAHTSRSADRLPFAEKSLLQYFVEGK